VLIPPCLAQRVILVPMALRGLPALTPRFPARKAILGLMGLPALTLLCLALKAHKALLVLLVLIPLFPVPLVLTERKAPLARIQSFPAPLATMAYRDRLALLPFQSRQATPAGLGLMG
jgi:hypothetical protein